MALADQPLRDLLDQVAAQSSAPGGGSSAAWATAMAAGLVEMAASFTLSRPRYAGVHLRMMDVRREACELRRAALELAEHDGEAYAPVLEALRLPERHPQRAARLDETRSRASEGPLEIAAVATLVAELAAEAVRDGSEHLRGDAITGVLLAEAAARAAVDLVQINLAGREDDPRLTRAAGYVARAAAARNGVLDTRGGVPG